VHITQMDTLTMERAALVEIGRVYVMHVMQINFLNKN